MPRLTGGGFAPASRQGVPHAPWAGAGTVQLGFCGPRDEGTGPLCVPKLTPDLLAPFCQFLGGRVCGAPLLSALVPRRPGARWMRVGVYCHAGSIAPLNTPVSPRGTPFRLRILDFICPRLLEFTSIHKYCRQEAFSDVDPP